MQEAGDEESSGDIICHRLSVMCGVPPSLSSSLTIRSPVGSSSRSASIVTLHVLHSSVSVATLRSTTGSFKHGVDIEFQQGVGNEHERVAWDPCIIWKTHLDMLAT